MIFIRNIWSSLKKEPLTSLLFILQIAIAAFIIFNTCFEYKYTKDRLDATVTSYSKYTFYYMAPRSSGDVDSLFSGDTTTGFDLKMDNFIEQMRQIKGIKLPINNYSFTLVVEDTCEHIDAKDKNGMDTLIGYIGDTYSFWEGIMTDKLFFEMFPIKLDSGRFFTDEEFELTYEKGQVIPVLLGYDFKKYYNIGDTIPAYINYNLTEADRLATAEVIGFIADGETFPNNVGSTLYSYSNQVVIPYNYRRPHEYTDVRRYNDMFAEGYMGMYILIEQENAGETVKILNQLLDENGLSDTVRLLRLLSSTVTIANNYKEIMSIRIVLTCIMIVFAFISIVLMTINRITSNIRNYAIHLISRGTYTNVYSYVIGEIFTYSLIGFIVGANAYSLMTISKNYVVNMPTETAYGYKYGWSICLTMLALFAIISFVIVYARMKKTDLSSVIRDKVYSDGSKGTGYKAVTVAAFAFVSVCIIFTISYLVYNKSVDMYYRHFYTDHAKLVSSYQHPSAPIPKPEYKELSEDYVVYKLINNNYTELAPYIRGMYYEGDVELPNIVEGRFFNEDELYGNKKKQVAVMGKKAYEDFAEEDEKGNVYFTYAGTKYTVIGVMGKADGTETKVDEWVFIPFDTSIEKFSTFGSYVVDGRTKATTTKAAENLVASLEKKGGEVDMSDYTPTQVVVGPTDTLFSLAVMICMNIVILCMYYTDKKQYTISVKKFLGYSKLMIFGDIFGGFLRWSAIGFGLGVGMVLLIILTPLKDFAMFGALSLNLPTVIFSFICTALLALIFSAISIIRAFNRDTSEAIRG